VIIIIDVITSAAIGFGVGAVTSITGIIKNKPNVDWRGVEWKKAVPTMVFTGCVGAYLGYSGMPISEVSIDATMASLASVGAVEWGTNIIKGVLKWLNFI